MAIAETVKNYLAQKSVDYDLVPHPHSGSSHETAEASHVREDHIAKGVIVKDASGYAMVVVPASNYVEMKHVRKELDRELELVAEDEFAIYTMVNDNLKVSKKYLLHAKFEVAERIWFYLIPTAQGRVKWLRKHKKLAMLGDHVHWQPRKYPTDGNMLKIHDNVTMDFYLQYALQHLILPNLLALAQYTILSFWAVNPKSFL